MARRAIFILLLTPNLFFFLSAAQATQQPQTIYQGITTTEETKLDLLIPKNLDPGYKSITVTVTDKNQVSELKTLDFCKTLDGTINWNNICPDVTVMVSQQALSAIHIRSKLPKYNPRSDPKKTTDIVITSLAALTVATSTKSLASKVIAQNSTKHEGYLSGLSKGGLLLSVVLLGPGDRLREKRVKSSKSGSRLTTFSSRLSATSPLLSRIFVDGNYLRATLQNFALFNYPLALALGFFAAKSVGFQAMPPSIAYMVAILALGIFDSLSGLAVVLSFSALALGTGHVGSLSSFLTLVGLGLVGFSPILLASVFRPLRRTTTDFNSYWERITDYLLASVLTGWVVKQIVLGLAGLSGLQLPITAYAHSLGVIAGVLIAVRYGLEDLVSYLYPARMQAIEPTYQDQSKKQSGLRIVMQIFVFLLVAEPFFGNTAALWIGLSFFGIPLILSIFESRFPKSSFVSRWIPKGIIEMLTMTTVGYLIARVLNWYPQGATGYLLTAFVLLGIPGFILKVLPLFAGEPSDAWKESRSGKWVYRIGGVIALVFLGYIISTGLLLSNNL